MEYTPFVYKWTHLPTLMWYVGVHYRKGCHPDIDDGYLGSSKYVAPLIKANPEEWKREIIATGSKADMCFLEKEILELFDARHDPRSFNRNNAGSPKGFRGAPWNKGKKTGPNPAHSEFMKNQTPWNKGLKGVSTSWNVGMSGEQSHRFGKKLEYKKPHTTTPAFAKVIEGLKQMNKIKNVAIHACPHCQKVGEGPAMIRWHFANCRQKVGK